MKTIVSCALILLAAAQCRAESERASIAGVYLYENGPFRFVLCLPENGSVFFSVYRSIDGKLKWVRSSVANPKVENGVFKIRRHTFRVDRIERAGWPLRRELTQVRYTDENDEDRDVEWRYEHVCPL